GIRRGRASRSAGKRLAIAGRRQVVLRVGAHRHELLLQPFCESFAIEGAAAFLDVVRQLVEELGDAWSNALLEQRDAEKVQVPGAPLRCRECGVIESNESRDHLPQPNRSTPLRGT